MRNLRRLDCVGVAWIAGAPIISTRFQSGVRRKSAAVHVTISCSAALPGLPARASCDLRSKPELRVVSCYAALALCRPHPATDLAMPPLQRCEIGEMRFYLASYRRPHAQQHRPQAAAPISQTAPSASSLKN
eukprot:scaffold23495_cov112-Isochrysis_galbana.AAC.12